MRKLLFTACALAMASGAMAPGAAFAEGGQAPQTLPPVLIQAETYDWSGAYVGLGYSMNTGDIDFFNPDFDLALDDGSGPSVFVGYQFQNGNLVYGGELAYYLLNEQNLTGFPASSSHLRYVVDASARLGFALDRLLVYGQFGYSAADYYAALAGAGVSLSGFNYGIGFDYAVSDQFSIGLLYVVRDLEGERDSVPAGQTSQVDLNSIALRFAYRF